MAFSRKYLQIDCNHFYPETFFMTCFQPLTRFRWDSSD